ncbi:erythromycin esterase [Tsukamurella asaccharolytica]|uniref:Erythromycin esterase n=1 Tax=Tsukamurella asaccharolytica TaxID=2592067 RepID=A0A5C5RAT4_9ACTN|nr:DUF6194 family protein [Tsukamurella asaccharolytica]TWS19614.1 erythromycin esterase [Tsukamurella asaccharolytica]
MTDSNAREAVIALLENLPDSTVDTIAPGAIAADGKTPVPEIAWGDTFVYYTPNGEPGVMPYLTIVTKNYPEDALSDLDRPGAFRLNANVGREVFTELIGYPPSDHAVHAGEWDYATDGAVIPHPLFAKLGWVSVVNPGTGPEVRALLERARAHAQKH